MKWIIYILLLANLGFGLWSYRSQELASANTPSADDNDNLRLVLVKEFLAQQKRAPTAAADGNPEVSGSCYTLGPFKSVDAANSVRKQLKGGGVTPKRRMSTDTSRKGFWVFLPPAASHAKARQKIEALKAKGIKDYFLVATGDQTNAVSLGVFSQSDTAQRRFEQIVNLGFKPVIHHVDLPLREYWLDWPVEQSLDPKVLGKIRKDYDGVGQATRHCAGNT